MRRKENQEARKRFSPKMQGSLLFVFFLVILAFLVLIGRMIYLTRQDGERYEKRVLSQQTYVSNAIPYRRGEILDRNMTKLAVSEKVYNLILDPVTILEKEEQRKPTIEALHKCFQISTDEVNEILKEKSESRYVQMKEYKGLDEETVESFRTLQNEDKLIQGVWFEEEYVRRYPLSTVGSTIIGFTQKGDSNVGNWGIEEKYNEELSGSNGREYGYFNADLELERTVKAPIHGNNIISTIDSNVQRIVEKRIEAFKKEPGALNMAVILMNPQNGEIYAMASNQSFDLNNPRDLSQIYSEEELAAMSEEEMSAALSSLWRNYCISNVYEPGSTFKPFTVAAALEENIVKSSSSFNCTGTVHVGDRDISCNVHSGHGVLNLKQTLMVSCNAALMQIGEKLGSKNFAFYTDLFGFGEKTGIDLPGEADGIIYDADGLRPVELATCSFGQGNTVTMVQMVSAFSSLINGGNYYKPHIVKEIQNENGATVEKVESTLIKKTVSKSTSDKIREYLFDTVESGTAKPAKVAGYEIGGKTGTAEKIPRDKINYVVSFMGFAPVDNPEVVVYVVIDQPNVEDQPHSTFATEFAGSLMEEVLPFLGVYPNESKIEKTEEKKNGKNEEKTENTDENDDLEETKNSDEQE